MMEEQEGVQKEDEDKERNSFCCNACVCPVTPTPATIMVRNWFIN